MLESTKKKIRNIKARIENNPENKSPEAICSEEGISRSTYYKYARELGLGRGPYKKKKIILKAMSQPKANNQISAKVDMTITRNGKSVKIMGDLAAIKDIFPTIG